LKIKISPSFSDTAIFFCFPFFILKIKNESFPVSPFSIGHIVLILFFQYQKENWLAVIYTDPEACLSLRLPIFLFTKFDTLLNRNKTKQSSPLHPSELAGFTRFALLFSCPLKPAFALVCHFLSVPGLLSASGVLFCSFPHDYITEIVLMQLQ